jgi:hypothetical protein
MDRSRKPESIQSKACSEATIQSVATSTQEEKDGIGLDWCLRKRRRRRRGKVERENRGVNPTTLAPVMESYVLD